MANYFSYVPDFQYVSRTKDEKYVSNYDTIKNLFKRAKLREDIFSDLSFFEKYTIQGDERPDYVSYKFYGDSSFDWVILLSNNILNVYNEWPKPGDTFEDYLISKYGSVAASNAVKCYKTNEVKNTDGVVIVKKGLEVPQTYSISYFDPKLDQDVLASNITEPQTYRQYEEEIENAKRNIYVLKSKYLNVMMNDIEKLMTYKKGGDQYVNPTLKKGNNIRLYE